MSRSILLRIRYAGLTGIVLAVLFLVIVPNANAGSGAAPANRFSVEEAADFSKQIERDLAARGARIALVFRTGRDREDLPDGVRYTHGAFWVYQPIRTEDGETLYGYAVYNLYHGEEDRLVSNLVQDWPLDFARGDVVGEAGIIIPSPEMQRRLFEVMTSSTYSDMHNPAYSLVSNPFNGRYQNCNEFILRVLAAAVWETDDPVFIQEAINTHFRPAHIRAGFMMRVFGPSVDERLRIDDHNGAIRTVTFRSLADFMQTNNLASDVYELTADHLSQGVGESDA
ncbi:DUF2145 domain-containing protein [Hyphobacterium sp. HN65]|uniref:DUF2145 domain-containing protein n=1 Tax=Hyphobacterium lacteum TaxID=3116575 RepID=A0ABU7LTB5_9PROT|nr:DUF2145 domain-containing protein [Hyphobacterium sp. HN65]MEE2527128.1 DUF2145 domain-containing protein [Hyphobacterium sp. HN65]